jgi:hypothetical protein
MERRKIRDEADARACIAALKVSGMATAAWCRSEGIDGRSLRAWTLNLSRRAAPAGKRARAKPVQLIELVPSGALRRTARYVVRVGQHDVEVDDQFEESTLRRLVAVLASC